MKKAAEEKDMDFLEEMKAVDFNNRYDELKLK